MSNAKWCDLGQHPFPEGELGSTQVTIGRTVANQWGGNQPANYMQDVCAACASDEGLSSLRLEQDEEKAVEQSRARRSRTGGIIKHRALPNGRTDAQRKLDDAKEQGIANPDYIKWLEEQVSKPVGTDIDEELSQ